MNKYKRLVVEKKNKIADLGNKLVIEQGKIQWVLNRTKELSS